MDKLDIYNRLTEILNDLESDMAYSLDVVVALEEKLDEAKQTLVGQREVHAQLVRVKKEFSPNSSTRILDTLQGTRVVPLESLRSLGVIEYVD